MTESAAITLHLADVSGSSELVSPSGDLTRRRFLRWLNFLVANVYPTFTYTDNPSRFVQVEGARQAFCDSVDRYPQRPWLIVDAAAAGACVSPRRQASSRRSVRLNQGIPRGHGAVDDGVEPRARGAVTGLDGEAVQQGRVEGG
jgi:hypothetical protein